MSAKTDQDIFDMPLLVVEDDKESAATLRRVLERGGFRRIEVAATGTEALSTLSRKVRPPGLVILDLRLPDMDGISVLSEAVSEGVPVVVYTGIKDRNVVLKCFEEGAEDVILKPGDLEIFVAKIKQLLTKTLLARSLAATTRRNQKLFLNILQVMAKTLEAKDPYTRFHSENVARYSRRIAKRMGFSDDEVELIQIAGILHDFGKIGVAERILNKPGALTTEEFSLVKRHPLIASTILEPVEELGNVLDWIRHHHEHYDGSGYPKGASGEAIPLGARILQVADAFDAMTSRRPYSEARSRQEAIEEMRRVSGSQFDPKVVETFVDILGEEDHRRRSRLDSLRSRKAAKPDTTEEGHTA